MEAHVLPKGLPQQLPAASAARGPGRLSRPASQMSATGESAEESDRVGCLEQGCASMEFASLYVTNVACELEDSKDLKQLTVATVKATVTPNMEVAKLEQGERGGSGAAARQRRIEWVRTAR